jgi:tRNA U34 2-thiouridine synthase MnmA/TrmU
MARAVALLSGGLDSTLAVLLLRRQGIEVTALTCLMHFGCDMSDSSSCSTDASTNAARYGFEVKLVHLADEFTAIVKNPTYGYGRNMNPCIDCRILMLREARRFMDMTGADFVATGEVLGQRPMSQRKETFPLIDREAGLEGLVVRPLSARLLKPTIPELKGLVDRERLCNFSGRSRKPQMVLAEEFGLTDYPNPAGGCLLTDPNYSYRLRELLEHDPDPALKELHLLRVGRHFRLPGGLKAVVGRDEKENLQIRAYAEERDVLLDVVGHGSPLVTIGADADTEALVQAASLCARYSDAKHLPMVSVAVLRNAERFQFEVPPAGRETVESLRIQNPRKDRTAKKAVKAG